MTKETKIGLLAGLAFIIVIGIVLSDHLTSSTEPPPAPLGSVGNNVRATFNTPAQPENAVAIVVPPSQVSPHQPVPTPSDLENQANASAVIKVGPPTQQPSGQVVRSSVPTPPAGEAVLSAPAQFSHPRTEDSVAATETPNTALARLARDSGEPVVAVAQGNAISTAGMTDYVVQEGDTLSHIAQRTLGSSNKANVDAIIRANPGLAPNPNKIIVGKTYKIPGAPAANVAQSQSAPASISAQQTPPTPPAAGEYWYTVKEGDSLWKIANEQLGKGGSAVAALKELNKDILNGGDTVYTNMRLRLPGKPIASAN